MKQVDDPVVIQKIILKYTCYLGGFLLLVFVIKGDFDIFWGLLFGILISILLLRLKFLHISRSLKMEEEKANSFIRNRYFIEYFIYFVVLLVAFKNSGVNFIGTVMGLYLIKVIIFGWAVVSLKGGRK